MIATGLSLYGSLDTRMRVTLALLASVAALFAQSSASPVNSRSTYAVKGSHPVPAGWTRLSRAPADHEIELRIGLKQGDFAELERQLYQVSNPTHNSYGQHLSGEAVHNLIKPCPTASAEVHDWLYESGLSRSQLSYTPAKDWIKIKLPVAEIERLLDTEYHTFEHEDGRIAVRAPEWSLPRHLHDYIATIQPTNSFFGPRRKLQLEPRDSKALADPAVKEADVPAPPTSGDVSEVCQTSFVTPTCLRTLYGTIDYTVQSADKNTMSLTDYLGELNLRSDAQLYLENYRPEAVSGAQDFTQVSIAGGTIQQTPLTPVQLANRTGIEGALDVQTMLGIAWPTPLIAYSTGGQPPFKPDALTPTNTNEPYLTWLDYILSLPDPLPSVVSTSYDDSEQTVPKDYAISVCNAFAQLGARGVTVLFASGDSGVGADGACYTNDGRNASTFLPEFPSTCPYITSVGGTYQFNPEVAVFRNRSGSIYTAGGGFSYYFDRPKYQEEAVSSYLANVVGDNYAGLYNPHGRGYPDIAAQSLNFTTYWNGTLLPVSGTSAATPCAAGVLALVNDALIAAGKPTLGFINPWVYSGGYKALNDILSGSSAGCGTEGFPAAAGWDAVTGYGTPRFADILASKGVGGEGSGWGDWNGWQ